MRRSSSSVSAFDLAILGFLLGLLFDPSPSATASSRIAIKDLKVEGDCSLADVTVISTADQDVLHGNFESLSAKASGDSHDKEVCLLRYRVELPRDKTLQSLGFTVDSHYALSSQGEVRVTVKHRVGNSKSRGTTEFRASDDGDPKKGVIEGVSGILPASALSAPHQKKGASIPVVTQIIVSVVNDEKGESNIRAKEGASFVSLQP